MDYITRQLLPGALTDCAALVLRTVSGAGVWMPSPAALNFDQLRALLALRNAGYIEYAAFGGYRLRGVGQTVKPTQTATEFLRAHNIPFTGVVRECKGALRRSGARPSWAVCVPTSAKLPTAFVEACGEIYRDGTILVFQLKEGG